MIEKSIDYLIWVLMINTETDNIIFLELLNKPYT